MTYLSTKLQRIKVGSSTLYVVVKTGVGGRGALEVKGGGQNPAREGKGRLGEWCLSGTLGTSSVAGEERKAGWFWQTNRVVTDRSSQTKLSILLQVQWDSFPSVAKH